MTSRPSSSRTTRPCSCNSSRRPSPSARVLHPLPVSLSLTTVPADKKTYMKTKEAVPLLDIVHKLITHKSAIVTTPNSPLYRVKDIGAIQVHQFVSRSHSRAEKILDRCLHPANKLSLRIVAFDLLLYILSLKPAVRLRLTRSSFPCLLIPIVRLLSFSIASLPSVSSSARSVAPTLGRRASSLSVRPCPFVRFRFAHDLIRLASYQACDAERRGLASHARAPPQLPPRI